MKEKYLQVFVSMFCTFCRGVEAVLLKSMGWSMTSSFSSLSEAAMLSSEAEARLGSSTGSGLAWIKMRKM